MGVKEHQCICVMLDACAAFGNNSVTGVPGIMQISCRVEVCVLAGPVNYDALILLIDAPGIVLLVVVCHGLYDILPGVLQEDSQIEGDRLLRQTTWYGKSRLGHVGRIILC